MFVSSLIALKYFKPACYINTIIFQGQEVAKLFLDSFFKY